MVKANGTVFVVGEELSRDTEAQLRYLWSALQSRGGLSRFSEVRLRDGKRLQENLRASASAVFVGRVPIDLINFARSSDAGAICGAKLDGCSRVVSSREMRRDPQVASFCRKDSRWSEWDRVIRRSAEKPGERSRQQSSGAVAANFIGRETNLGSGVSHRSGMRPPAGSSGQSGPARVSTEAS